MNKLIQNPYAKWCMIMFPYGAYRHWKCEIKEPFDLWGYRILGSFINGIYYSSPIGVVKIFELGNRLDIKYHNLDKRKYKDSYQELLGYNYNTF